MEDRVTRIRRTKAGELLLKLDKSGKVIQELQTVVSATLEESAQVEPLSHMEALSVMDLDETTTAEEVMQAFTTAIGPGVLTPENIKLRASYSGTQAAKVLFPMIAAKQFMGTGGKLRIGWVNCRVRWRITTPRCYRFHKNGHLARNCKSAIDRSIQYFRCYKEGHEVVTCSASNGRAAKKAKAPRNNEGS